MLLSATFLPQVLNVVQTYAHYHGVDVVLVPEKEGVMDKDAALALVEADDVAGLICCQHNRYGLIEDFTGLADACHAHKTLLAINSVASDLAVLRTPGEWGADIACGDAQSLGIPMGYGGPYIGYLCVKEALVRRMPGRLVGATTDANGQRAFVLTMQAREQHIRREKATSNICSNESLMALWVTVYLSLMGPQGMRQVNEESYKGAHYLYDALLATGKFQKVFDAPFLKEFVLKPLVPADVLQRKLYDAGFFGALETEDGYVSFCVTEKRTKAEIDRLVETIKLVEIINKEC